MTGAGEAYEVPVWQPSTEGAAVESVPWTRAGADVRRAAVRIWVVTVVLAGTFGWLFAVGASWVAVVLLGLATVVGLLLSVVPVLLARSERSDNRLLESQPWRVGTVEVFAPEDPDEAGLFGGETRLLVDGTMWLSWYPARWADQQVLARTGRIWLVGPNADGKVLFCSAGLAVSTSTAEVVENADGPAVPVRPEQVAPARLPRAADDLVAAAGLANDRRVARAPLFAHLLAFLPAVAALAIVLVDDNPHRLEGIIGVGIVVLLLVASLLSDVRTYLTSTRIARLLESGPWTAISVALDSRTKLVDRVITVRLQAILTDGHITSVRLRSGYPLLANIAETGQLWVAGDPTPGRPAAAGLPGYPFVSLAHIGQ
ncbi:MAG TPA: hypothetical protein VGX25_20310 [Actinophytocola sp.]|uniref:hypothetical protein n=1 Tax=Actinophytocola sp. TaxID=1872138 RepID=UPI002DDCFDF8|nr:hypothetical protein [Actinophytocola sp.]HEV2781735.1 hypothetical protein [Actinophytocola sp.]